jgi:hypothetical protein
MNLYTNLAAVKDELRRAKDHEQTIRAIAEYVELSGKNADDRKRELAYILSQHAGYRKAQDVLRDAEYAVDQAQAAIDAADAERRDREWSIRARLAEALRTINVESEDAVPDWLADQQTKQRILSRVEAQMQIDDLYPTK